MWAEKQRYNWHEEKAENKIQPSTAEEHIGREKAFERKQKKKMLTGYEWLMMMIRGGGKQANVMWQAENGEGEREKSKRIIDSFFLNGERFSLCWAFEYFSKRENERKRDMGAMLRLYVLEGDASLCADFARKEIIDAQTTTSFSRQISETTRMCVCFSVPLHCFIIRNYFAVFAPTLAFCMSCSCKS